MYIYISIKYSTVCTSVVGLNTPDAVLPSFFVAGREWRRMRYAVHA